MKPLNRKNLLATIQLYHRTVKEDYRKILEGMIDEYILKFFAVCASQFGKENNIYLDYIHVFKFWVAKVYRPILLKQLSKAVIIGIKSILKTTLSEYFLLLYAIIYPDDLIKIWKLNENEASDIIKNIKHIVDNNTLFRYVFPEVRPGKTWATQRVSLNLRKAKDYNYMSMSIYSDKWGKKAHLNLVDDSQKPEHFYKKAEFETSWRTFKRLSVSKASGFSATLALMNPLFDGDQTFRIKMENKEIEDQEVKNQELKESNIEKWTIIDVGPFNCEIPYKTAEEIIDKIYQIPDHCFRFPTIWGRIQLLNAYISSITHEFSAYILNIIPKAFMKAFKGKYQFVDEYPKGISIIPVFDTGKGPNENSKRSTEPCYNAMVLLGVDFYDPEIIKPVWVLDVYARIESSWDVFLDYAVEIMVEYDQFATEMGYIFEYSMIENNLGHSTILRQKLNDVGLNHIGVSPIITTTNKENRIYSLEPYFKQGYLKLINKERFKDEESYDLLIDELDNFPMVSHVDILDAISMGELIFNPTDKADRV